MIEIKKKRGPKRKTVDEYFWSKVKKTKTCWLWAAHCHPVTGYGLTAERAEHSRAAHRASWVFANGPIPEGMMVCHKCDTPACVRPDHLFLGTNSDNMRDAWAKGRGVIPDPGRLGNRTHCPHGHPFNEENTYHYDGRGRYCRVCRKLAARRYSAKSKAEECLA